MKDDAWISVYLLDSKPNRANLKVHSPSLSLSLSLSSIDTWLMVVRCGGVSGAWDVFVCPGWFPQTKLVSVLSSWFISKHEWLWRLHLV